MCVFSVKRSVEDLSDEYKSALFRVWQGKLNHPQEITSSPLLEMYILLSSILFPKNCEGEYLRYSKSIDVSALPVIIP